MEGQYWMTMDDEDNTWRVNTGQYWMAMTMHDDDIKYMEGQAQYWMAMTMNKWIVMTLNT